MVCWIRQRLEIALDLVTPAREIGVDHASPLVARDLDRPKGLDAATPAKLASARSSKVPNPLRITARRDQIALAIELERHSPLVRPRTARVGIIPTRMSNGFKTRLVSQPGFR